MNDFGFGTGRRPTTAAPSTVRTPRLYPNGMRQKFQYHSPNQILPSMPNQPEAQQISILKQNFNIIVETVSKLLSHSCSTPSFRNSIAGQCSETEHLFTFFLQQVSQQLNSKQHFRRGKLSQDSVRTSFVNSTIPFLKCWATFSKICSDIRYTGPEAIKQTIDANFEIIATSLNYISISVGSNRLNIGSTSSKNVQAMLLQKGSLHAESIMAIESPADFEHIKQISAKIKTFSRLLNDCFSREFNQCGIPSNDLVKVRQKTYTACCDIVSALRGAYYFNNDMMTLYQCIDAFQESLQQTCEKLELPMNLLPRKRSDSLIIPPNSADESLRSPRNIQRDSVLIENQNNEAENEELPNEFFESCKTPLELTTKGRENIDLFINKQNLTKFLENMAVLCAKQEMQLKEIQEKLDALQKEKDQQLHEMNQKNEQIIKLMEEQIQQLKQNTSNNNNQNTLLEMKECLINVASSLSFGLEKGDFVYNNDTQLIGTVNEYVKDNEALYQNMKNMRENENMCVELLHSFMENQKDEKDVMALINICKNEITELRQKSVCSGSKQSHVEFLMKMLQYYEQFVKGCSSVGELTEGQLEEKVYQTAQESIRAKEREFISLFAEKSREIDSQVNNIQDKFSNYVEVHKSDESALNNLSATVKDVVSMIESDRKKQKKFETALIEVRDRLAAYMSVPVPDGQFDTAAIELVSQLENMAKQESQKKTDDINDFLLSSLDAISTKLKGGNEKDQLAKIQLSPQMHVSVAMKLVDSYITSHTNMIKELDSTKKFMKQIIKLCIQETNSQQKPENSNITEEIISITDKLIKEMISAKNKEMEELQNKVNSLQNQQAPNQQKPQKQQSDFSGLEKIFDLVPVTNKQDPKVFIPEICSSYTLLTNTITALKPFASVLNEIFSSFDCKYTSFIPGSPQCKMLRQQVMQLHSSLSALVPSKVNSLVFLVLSRFIALLSSFLSALTAISFTPTESEQNNYLYELQQENQKLHALIEAQNSI